MDAFDKQPEKPVETIEVQPIQGWAKKMERRFTKRWATFRHPRLGIVAGYCEKAKYIGLTEAGKIPDFELSLCGRNPKVRNVMTISLVENEAQFFDNERDAVQASETTK